jgi:hypothetical protein
MLWGDGVEDGRMPFYFGGQGRSVASGDYPTCLEGAAELRNGRG